MKEKWDVDIKPQNKLLDLNLKDVWTYKDLLFLFVKRDFIAEYKQTILGPIWYLIEPIVTALTYFIILHKMGGMPTDGLPPLLFYLSGLTIWNYFSTSLIKTSDTFIANSNIFGKVYFPRLIVPLSIIISNLIKFGLQFGLLIFFVFYFTITGEFNFEWGWRLFLLPIPIFLMAGMSLGFGLLISSLTTKYRDLKFAMAFGIRLFMYASSVILSINTMPQYFYNIFKWNPIAGIVELFRAILLGVNSIDVFSIIYSVVFLIILVFVGVVVFGKTEKNFMDTV